MRRASRSPARRFAVVSMVLSLCAALVWPGGAVAVDISWTAQFGTRYPDDADGLAIDRTGNLYVIGQTSGELPGQKAVGMIDCFVRRLDPAGHEVWTRQFGSPERDLPKGVTVDDAGNVYVVGQTFGSLPGQTSHGGWDAFIRKYSPSGDEVWTRQFGGGGAESAAAVRVDHAGNVYVVGGTRATLPGQTNIGDWDGFLVKFDPAGNTVWTRQFGTEAEDYAMAVALDANGAPVVAGETAGRLAGATSAGGLDGFVRQYDAAGNVVWTRQFGSPADDYAVGVAVAPSGDVLAIGTTMGALPGHTSHGGDTDAYIVAFGPKGGDQWSSQFGTTGGDDAEAIAFDAAGHAFVAGRVGAALPGATSAGGSDAFLAAVGPTGAILWARQFGGPADDYALGLAIAPGGVFYLAGGTTGALPGQTNLGQRDAFVVSLS
ncbi:MAG TPA: SBBP repeat-containing protein [Acidimicrobiia bacterium]|nr:SBBP repeat-containing protein [Acidimicrobiia bacterium]